MSKEKISSQEVVELVSTKASVSKRAAEEFVKVMISTIEEALQAGEVVKIKGFGTFKLQWVEPRKSVNVNTKEEIILAGYHKVSFTPDSVLKDVVNEPFAHLTSVSLDTTDDISGIKSAEDDEQETEVEEPILDPLRIFEEQASEIKNLLSEIQALSLHPKQKTAEPEKKSIEIKDYDLSEFIENENSKESETELIDAVNVNDEDIKVNVVEETIAPIVEEFYSPEVDAEIQHIDNNSENNGSKSENIDAEYQGNPFVANLDFEKKSRWKIWLLALIGLALGSYFTIYFTYPPVTLLTNNAIGNTTTFILESFGKVQQSGFVKGIQTLWTPESSIKTDNKVVVVPKDSIQSDSLKIIEPVDSLQILFDTPRVFTEYLGTERIVAGSRLARMAERYYGKSDFWVYIYEANKDRIKHPDSIGSGTLIYIPKVDARLIDVNNPRCLKKARELHDFYVNQKAD